MNKARKNNQSWIAGMITATAASLCCIAPVLALLGGASGAASSLSWIEPFRPYLIGVTILAFGIAWFQKLKPQKKADCCSVPERKKPFVQTIAFLALVTVIAALLMTFPYYSKVFYPNAKEVNMAAVNQATLRQAYFSIEGMTCEACTEHVNGQLAMVGGVVSFRTSYDSAGTLVKYDYSKVSPDSITAAIERTGYLVTKVDPR